jgi:predicted nuclease with TOPRIM domain
MREVDMAKIEKEVQESLAKVDIEKIKAEIANAIKEVDLAKIQKEIKESLSKVDYNKIKSEIADAMKEVDLVKIQKEVQESLQKVKEVDLKKLEQEMERVKEELKIIRPELEKELSKAKEEIAKAKATLKEYKSFVDGLQEDGLISKKDGYTLKHKDGVLYINGEKAAEQTYTKYRTFLDKHKKFNIEKSNDDFDIDID